MARTQQERRESAIARLLDASIATIVDLGYARATAAAITKRANLSHGALFRHFDTMGDFMAATAQEGLRRQMSSFAERVAQAAPADLGIGEVLQIMREVMGSDTNAVLYELTNAARTDSALRAIMQAGAVEYLETVRETARALPGMTQLPEDLFDTLVVMVTDMFDAEVMLRSVRPLPDAEVERRIEVVSLIYAWASSLGDPSATPGTDPASID